MREKSIIPNIIVTTLYLYAIQIGLLLVVSSAYRIKINLWNWYIPLTISMHAIIAIVLCLARRQFYTIPDNRYLSRVNLTNVLSLFRLSSTPTLILLAMHQDSRRIQTVIIVWVGAVFLSDFLDGIMARRLKQTTKIGQYIDSWSDYLILLTVTILLYSINYISVYLLISALVRFILPILGTIVVYIITRDTDHRTSWFGKSSVFSVMFVYAFSFMRVLFNNSEPYQTARVALEWIVIVGFILPSLVIQGVAIVRSTNNSYSSQGLISKTGK